MMLGCARTSTFDQVAGLEAQERDLSAAGVDRIFAEQTSSIGDRPKLDAALDYLCDGDVLVVTKPDRLVRSVADLCRIAAAIERKGASLRILSMNLDTAASTGRTMLNVIGGVAQFVREMMLECQRDGIVKA
jgi:DNA invertase Pin-like site-specific DNA recombinase